MPGLRREEVALLAGVSVEYYARMERGDLGRVSQEVLDSLASALQLDEAETDYLNDLAYTTGPQFRRRQVRQRTTELRPSLQRFLDAVTGAPIWVLDRRLDYVASNSLGQAVFSPLLEDPESGGNTALFTFLNPGARDFFVDWEKNADDIVATLRSFTGHNPEDRKLAALVDHLRGHSVEFRDRWSAHDVRHHRTGIRRVCHPELGELEFSYEAMSFTLNPAWTMFAYTTEPGSVTEGRMEQLMRATVLRDKDE